MRWGWKHERIHGAVGSYVVNALDPDELEEFEAHLAVCPTCSREVAEFCETAAELSLLASAPPAALRGSILCHFRDQATAPEPRRGCTRGVSGSGPWLGRARPGR